MKLIIAEKNDAARQIAERLSTGKPKKDKVYNTAIYRFEWKGEECVTIGLAGHILAPDFCDSVLFDKKLGWYSVTEDGEMLPADMPDGLARPPYDTKRKPFLADGISIKGWKLESLPYLTWAPVIKLPAEKELIRSLKNLAKKSDSVIIATDFDREGELIGSDALNKVREVAPDLPVARAQYSSFTKAEITQAFDNLVSLDQNLADAGESRQHIDLIWGAVLTRYLTLAKFGGFGNVRSAGRVQTPTLALVVERERERMAFVPEDYWQIRGMGAAQGAAEDDRFKIAHKTARFTDKDAAETAYGHVDGATTATVAAVTKRSRKQQPPTPFATTSLQAAAAAEGISPARTMRIAESLYMAGLISYPRVDNTVYPATLDLGAVVSDLAKINPALAPVCKKVLAGPMKPTRGKVETTDHPPIYPTGEGDPSTLDGGQRKLYDLIARRFLATLMGPATIENTKLELDVNGEPFVASGDVLVTPGFREAYPYGLKRDEQMPPLEQGDTVDVFDIKLEAKQTEPPARYSQGKLVQEMEKRGLGTKSTRASIIERLYAVRYLKNDPVEPSQLGIAIIDALTQFAPRITSPDMTSELDGDMTRVERGEDTEEHVVTHSRALLAGVLDELLKHTQELGDAISDAVTADARVGACPKCGSAKLTRDPDTLDTWFSSALWPFSTLGWPNEDSADLKYFYPTNTLVTGYDIIGFWVSRMIFSGLAYTGKAPFSTVCIHGIVRDSQGRKMSKSLGNGIDPLEVIAQYGADALRFMLVDGSTPGNDMRYIEKKVEAARNFANKLWNATRFVLMNLPEDFTPGLPSEDKLDMSDKWVLTKLNQVAGAMTDNLDHYEMGLAAAKINSFIWDVYCDWFIEIAKPRLNSGDAEQADTARRVLVYVLDKALKLLHPFMPFITEELYQALPGSAETIMTQSWPTFDEAHNWAEEEEAFEKVMDYIKAVRTMRTEMNVHPAKKTSMIIETADPAPFRNAEVYLAKFAFATDVTFTEKYEGSTDGMVQVSTHTARGFIPMMELIDREKELARLNKEKAKAEKELAMFENQLANPKFVERAPAALVEEIRAKRTNSQSKLANIEQSIKALG